MNMTKRDLADIVLVAMAISFLVFLLTSLVSFGTDIAQTNEADKYMDKSIAVAFEALKLLVLVLLNYLLLFKRSLILALVVPDGDKSLAIPDGLEALTSYAFWIRLIGLYLFLTCGIEFIGYLGAALAAKNDFPHFWPFLVNPAFVGVKAICGLLLIGRAEWLARLLRLGGQGKTKRG